MTLTDKIEIAIYIVIICFFVGSYALYLLDKWVKRVKYVEDQEVLDKAFEKEIKDINIHI